MAALNKTGTRLKGFLNLKLLVFLRGTHASPPGFQKNPGVRELRLLPEVC